MSINNVTAIVVTAGVLYLLTTKGKVQPMIERTEKQVAVITKQANAPSVIRTDTGGGGGGGGGVSGGGGGGHIFFDDVMAEPGEFPSILYSN